MAPAFAPAEASSLLQPGALVQIQARLATEGADGWLLYDFRDQNPLAHKLLGLGKTTRRAFAFFPAAGAPRLLRHGIEASAWTHWPWDQATYTGWQTLEDALIGLLDGASRIMMEVSPGGAVPTVDRVPFGTVDMLRRVAGVEVVSSADLVSQFHGGWGPDGARMHRAAAETVRAVALAAFARVGEALGEGAPLREGDLMQWIHAELVRGGLSVHTGCIVAVGANAADPHYHPAGAGALLEPGPQGGQSLLIDLWGGEPGGIPADQTWMAWVGGPPTPRALEVWEAVRDARDVALDLLRRAGSEARVLEGWEVDRVARSLLDSRGMAEAFVHRLGHSIDSELHGSGANLDDLETRDARKILPGTGFSVEPGVYLPGEIGMRTEVNVFWTQEGPEVTPMEIQTSLVHIQDGALRPPVA
jgi:Xaa-Pro aminopeptidase